MAINSNQLLPFDRDAHWPFSGTPYRSRTHDHEINPSSTQAPQLGSPSNYVLSGFRPGFPLQAAELNEIQDRFYLQQTLTITMMHNWITSSVSSLWDNLVPGSDQNLDASTRGLGEGEAAGLGNTAISAPGWRGVCPLYPFAISDPNYGGTEGTWASRQVSVTDTGGNISIKFNPGWYLTELYDVDTTDPDYRNGLKYWIQSDEEFNITVPKGGSGTTTVGLNTAYEVVSSCQDEICNGWENPNGATDISLNDEAEGGTYNINTGGADRYRVYFTDAFSSSLGTPGFGPVLKINHTTNEVRYMNNLLILKWS